MFFLKAREKIMWKIEKEQLDKLDKKYKILKIWGDIAMWIALATTVVTIGSMVYLLVLAL
jgi:hypothetical protein